MANNNKVLYDMVTHSLTRTNTGITVLSLGRRTTRRMTSRVGTGNNGTVTINTGILSTRSLGTTTSGIRTRLKMYSVLMGKTNNGGPGKAASGRCLRGDSLATGSRTVGAFFSLSPTNVNFIFGLGFVNALLAARTFYHGVTRGNNAIVGVSSVGTFAPLAGVPTCSNTGTTVSGFAH